MKKDSFVDWFFNLFISYCELSMVTL